MFGYIGELLSGSAGMPALILICIYIGFVIACFMALYDKRVMGEFIRELLRHDATSPEKALTLAELGYAKKRAVISGLRGKGIFAGLVYEASEKVDFDREDHAMPIYRESFDRENAKFYLPEPLRYRAEVRFEKKGTHIMAVVVAVILFGLAVLIALLFMDRIMGIFNEWIESITGAFER